MENSSKIDFQNKFDSIAENYDLISNKYTIKRRTNSLRLDILGVVLEVGSGSGQVTESSTCDVICIDFSYKMCQQAKKRHSSVLCCDAEFLPFKENFFDGIIAAEVIYYLLDPCKFILNCKKILKKHGKLYLTLPNDAMEVVAKIRSGLRKIGFRRMYFNDGLKNFMKIDYLKSLLIKNNFRIISLERQVIFPFSSLDRLNQILEKSILNRYCVFVIIKAEAQ